MKIFCILLIGLLWNANFSLGDSTCQRIDLKQTDTSAEIALNEFKKHDKFIQHDTFNAFIGFLDEYRGESNLRGSLDLADQLKVILRNVMSSYYVSTQSVYQWCGVAVFCFQSYLQQLQNTTKGEVIQQHHIVSQLLEEEIKKIHSAQQRLQQARSSLDDISAAALIPRLDADYEEYTNESKQQIQRFQSSIKESQKGVLSIIRDNDLTRDLKSRIQEIIKNLVRFEKLNNAFKEEIKGAELLAKKTKKNFEDEFNAMIFVKSQAQNAFDIIYTAINEDEFHFETNNLAKISVEKLVNVCGEYRARHDS